MDGGDARAVERGAIGSHRAHHGWMDVRFKVEFIGPANVADTRQSAVTQQVTHCNTWKIIFSPIFYIIIELSKLLFITIILDTINIY